MSMTLEKLMEYIEEKNLTVLRLEPKETYDPALVGLMERFGQEQPVLVYDVHKVLQILEDSGMTSEEAGEWYDYNIIGAWVGPSTPGFMITITGAADVDRARREADNDGDVDKRPENGGHGDDSASGAIGGEGESGADI